MFKNDKVWVIDTSLVIKSWGEKLTDHKLIFVTFQTVEKIKKFNVLLI